MHLRIYSHGFSISDFKQSSFKVLNRVCRYMGHYELTPTQNGRYENIMTCTYGGAHRDRSVFFFHINILDMFIKMMEDVCPEDPITEEMMPLFESDHVPMIQKDFRPPRPGQDRAVEFILNGKGNTKVICVEAGGGKTWIFNQAILKIQRRIGMVIKAQYLDKWAADIAEAHEVSPGDILVIRGMVDFGLMVKSAMAGTLTAKYILISNTTYRSYLSLYEDTCGVEGFAIGLPPYDLWGQLGVEVLGIDEGHQDFHFNHRLIVYSHVPLLVVLTGTPDPDNAFKDAVTKLTYPPEDRFVLPPTPPYLRITALTYSLATGGKIKWTNRGRPDYSQVALEKSIMANKHKLESYLDFIVDTVKVRFDSVYKPGRSIVIFAGTKLMVGHILKAVKKAYPKLKVLRLIGGDPYSNMVESDILITTTKSFGTAKDKPGLALSIMTEAVGDSQANQQHIKRLRKPPEGENYFTPEFVYFLCTNIQQHFRYHEKKKQLFAKMALSHCIEHSGVTI